MVASVWALWGANSGKIESVAASSVLGVDVEAEVELFRQPRQRLHFWQQLCHDADGLRAGVARMQCGKFDRDARALIDAAPGGSRADRPDRFFVIPVIALGIGGRG